METPPGGMGFWLHLCSSRGPSLSARRLNLKFSQLQMILHGVELDDGGRPIWFRFGILPVLHRLSGFRPSSDIPDWTRRWSTVTFHRSVSKLQDTMWKFDRAAGYVEKCRLAIERWVRREAGSDTAGIKVSDPDFSAHMAAVYDLPLHLDSMLMYLRIQADALAALVPYFYTESGTIGSRGFREQQKWFTGKPAFDPAYTTILTNETNWFDELAGKNPSGLRDVIVHRGGTYQLGWTNPSDEDQFELRAALVGKKGFVDEDVLAALTRMTSGWFSFLDSCCKHFGSRIAHIVPQADIDKQDELSRFLSCSGKELPSFWAYPRSRGGA